MTLPNESMAMLRLILDLQRIYKWKIHVWHGDHGWHQNSEHISNEIERWCKGKILTFCCEKTERSHVSTENKAREWRYKNLINQAKNISKDYPSSSCNHVLTGHTGSDRAETFLMNLARGAHIRGLSSLRERRELVDEITLIRPMLNFSREETIKICQEMNVPIWVDPSNSDDKFTRNRIRKDILPVLESIHSGSTMRIAKLADSLAYLQNDQYQLTKLAIAEISQEKGLSRSKISMLSLSARAIIFSQWIGESKAPNLSSMQLQELSQKVSQGNPPGSIDITKNWKIQWCKTYIALKNPQRANN